MTFTVGLTGGIGSGKSTVAAGFAALGATVIDTDVIAHALTAESGGAMPAIRQAFGDSVIAPGGALDRAAMRQRVFADPAERAQLESILHPMIRTEVEAQIRRAASADFSHYILLVVPLLIEAGDWRQRVDRIAVVDCPETVQIARVMQRGLARKEVEAILAAQTSRQNRLAAADDVIANASDLASLQTRVTHLHTRYFDLATQRS